MHSILKNIQSRNSLKFQSAQELDRALRPKHKLDQGFLLLQVQGDSQHP